MKRFVTTLISILLAGTMAFSLAACGGGNNNEEEGGNNQGGNTESGGGAGDDNTEMTEEQKWAKMFTDFVDLDNFTLETGYTSSSGLKYKGEYVTADTVYDNQMQQMVAAEFLQEIGDGENPSTSESTSTTKYDFSNGIIEEEYYEGKQDYTIVDGTTINEYSWSRHYKDDDTYEYYLENDKYIGYASNEQALAALKARKNPFSSILESEIIGTGEHADVKGTIDEVYEIFEYDETAGVYSAVIGVDINGAPEDMVVTVKIKVNDGAIVGYTSEMSMEMSLADMMGSMMDAEDEDGGDMSDMFEGFTYSGAVVETIELTNINSTVIAVPSDIDAQVEDEHIYSVITDEAAYKAMFDALPGNEGTIRLSAVKNSGYIYSYTEVEFNEELGLLKISEKIENYSDESRTQETKLYWATDDGINVYTAEYDNEGNSYYPEFTGWSDAVTEAVSGDKTAALIAKMPAEIQLYFNMNGKKMAEQFSLFELHDYNNYEADVALGDNEYRVYLDYGYNQEVEKLYINGYNVFDKNDDSAYISSNTYISLGEGNIIESGEGIPEIEGVTVTEAEWKAVVEPWYNLKNVTITEMYGATVLVDIAADGKSGKIYRVSDYVYNCSYLEFEVNDDGLYAITVYSCSYNGWGEDKQWYKDQYTVETLDMVLSYGNAYTLGYFSDYAFDGKPMGEIWESVQYNPMTKGYEIRIDEYTVYRLSVGTNSITFEGKTLSNVGTTVAGEIPADVLANAVER